MDQPSYCCNAGTTCEWDDAGHVACCASGDTCEGSPYSSGASEGVYQNEAECQCESEPSSTIGNVVPIVPVTEATVLTPAPTPEPIYVTTTVYQQPETTTTVAPVPESTTTVYQQPETTTTVAPVLESTTTVYNVPRSTTTVYNVAPAPVPEVTTSYTPAPSPETTTITQAPQEVVTEGNCEGYTTLTDAGVGRPVTTVGCDVIFNSGGRRVRLQWVEGFVLEVLGILGMALWWR